MKSSTRNFYEGLVTTAVEDIRSGVDCALDLQALAKRAALAPLHFHRIFRGLLGETPLEMHRRLRLERAAITLATTETAVTRVAFEAGYETHESFTRAFSSAFAASPSEFRAAAHAQPVPWTAPTKAMLAATSRIHANSAPNAPPTFSTEECSMNVTIIDCPSKYVLAVSHRGPYNAVSESFAKLDRMVRPAGMLALESVELVAIFHDDPEVTPAAELRADAGLVVPETVRPLAGLHALTIPAGKYARAVHVGPYEGLGDSWSQLMGHWLPKSGYRVATAPSYERYLNTPGNVPPSELLTELYVGLESPPDSSLVKDAG
jgi:AraC family transcriptional regulator